MSRVEIRNRPDGTATHIVDVALAERLVCLGWGEWGDDTRTFVVVPLPPELTN